MQRNKDPNNETKIQCNETKIQRMIQWSKYSMIQRSKIKHTDPKIQRSDYNNIDNNSDDNNNNDSKDINYDIDIDNDNDIDDEDKMKKEETNEETAEEEENNAITDRWYTGNSQ